MNKADPDEEKQQSPTDEEKHRRLYDDIKRLRLCLGWVNRVTQTMPSMTDDIIKALEFLQRPPEKDEL